MAKLTDKQKKKIICAYVQGATLTALGNAYGVCPSTIKRVIEKDPKTQKKANIKKEQNTQSVLEYMDENRDRALQIIDVYTKELLKPERIEKSSAKELATIMGIVIDKYTKTASAPGGDIEDLKALGDMLK